MSELRGSWRCQNNPARTNSVRDFKMLKLENTQKKSSSSGKFAYLEWNRGNVESQFPCYFLCQFEKEKSCITLHWLCLLISVQWYPTWKITWMTDHPFHAAIFSSWNLSYFCLNETLTRHYPPFGSFAFVFKCCFCPSFCLCVWISLCFILGLS